MATDAIPARVSKPSIVEATWFRFVVRTALALLALWALYFAVKRYPAFEIGFSNTLRIRDTTSWLAWVGPMAAAGFLFGLAAWLPLAKVRFLPSRLLLAGLALLPLAQFWWVFHQGFPRQGPGWLLTNGWFMDVQAQSVLAALSGVAIASGFRAQRSRPAPE